MDLPPNLIGRQWTTDGDRWTRFALIMLTADVLVQKPKVQRVDLRPLLDLEADI
jgi:hypothetical protein